MLTDKQKEQEKNLLLAMILRVHAARLTIVTELLRQYPNIQTKFNPYNPSDDKEIYKQILNEIYGTKQKASEGFLESLWNTTKHIGSKALQTFNDITDSLELSENWKKTLENFGTKDILQSYFNFLDTEGEANGYKKYVECLKKGDTPPNDTLKPSAKTIDGNVKFANALLEDANRILLDSKRMIPQLSSNKYSKGTDVKENFFNAQKSFAENILLLNSKLRDCEQFFTEQLQQQYFTNELKGLDFNNNYKEHNLFNLPEDNDTQKQNKKNVANALTKIKNEIDENIIYFANGTATISRMFEPNIANPGTGKGDLDCLKFDNDEQKKRFLLNWCLSRCDFNKYPFYEKGDNKTTQLHKQEFLNKYNNNSFTEEELRKITNIYVSSIKDKGKFAGYSNCSFISDGPLEYGLEKKYQYLVPFLKDPPPLPPPSATTEETLQNIEDQIKWVQNAITGITNQINTLGNINYNADEIIESVKQMQEEVNNHKTNIDALDGELPKITNKLNEVQENMQKLMEKLANEQKSKKDESNGKQNLSSIMDDLFKEKEDEPKEPKKKKKNNDINKMMTMMIMMMQMMNKQQNNQEEEIDELDEEELETSFEYRTPMNYPPAEPIYNNRTPRAMSNIYANNGIDQNFYNPYSQSYNNIGY